MRREGKIPGREGGGGGGGGGGGRGRRRKKCCKIADSNQFEKHGLRAVIY